MAGETIDYNLSFSDKSNSMQKRIDEAKALNREMTKAAQSAFKADGDKGISGQDYGRARGAVGTGAGARDFAKESQGLGGLVRLYATVAANLFAVGAAFNALREAMNTTNMVEGLNQLGATSGQSLGSLAKNLANASGGALSLRDAMEATAKATSAGMSAKQLMQLGSVAKNASQALGLSMTDAVSRLTRGITKLEPELLDELGIFTKLGKATDDYARSVGKSASELTDFERRQAFANAVLKEGTDKFNAINIPTNPYDKLLASLKDLAQNGLATVNTVLGPLLNSLSQSPTALTAGIAYLATTLIKQAIPAITQYREGLASSAVMAAKAAESRAADAKAAQVAQADKVKGQAEAAAENEVRAVDNAVKKIAAIRGSMADKSSKSYAILEKASQDVTKEELAHLNTVGKRFQKQGKNELAERYYEAARAIQASAAAEKAFDKAVADTTARLNAQQGISSAQGRAEMMAKRTAAVAASKQILSSASTDTSTIGVMGAFGELRKNIKESDMGPIRKTMTGISGAVTIATTAVSSFVGALQGYLALGAAIAGIAMLIDSWFTKNGEKAKAFTDALEVSEEAIKTYGRTLEYLSKIDSSEVFSARGLTAQANAIQGLVDGLSTLREKFQELDKATTGWDRFTDNLASLIGKDQLSKFAEGTVRNIVKTIAAIDSDVARETALKTVTAELGAAGDNQLAWLEAIKTGGPEAAKKVEAIEKGLKKLANAQSIVASRSTEFDESIKKLSDSYKDFTKSALDQSPLTKLGDDMITSSVKMVAALADPVAGINSMKKLLEDTSVLGIFNPAIVQELNRLKPEIDAINKKHGETSVALAKARDELAPLTLEYEKASAAAEAMRASNISPEGGDTAGLDKIEIASETLMKKQEEIRLLTKKDTEERAKIAELMNSPKFREMAVDAFIKGSELISRALADAFSKARIDLARGIITMIGSVPGIAKIESEINKQEFAQQRYMLKLQEDMLRAQYMNIAALMANTSAINLAAAKGISEGAMRSPEGIAAQEAARSSIPQLESEANITAKYQSFISGGKGAPTARSLLADINADVQKFGKESPAYIARLSEVQKGVQKFLQIDGERFKINTGEKLNNLKTEIRVRDENNQLVADNLKLTQMGVDTELKRIDQLQQQNGFLTETQIAKRRFLEDEQALVQYNLQLNQINTDRINQDAKLKDLKGLVSETALKELATNYTILETSKKTANTNEQTNKNEASALKEKLDINNRIFAIEERAINNRNFKIETGNILQKDSLEVQGMELQLAEKRNSYGPDELAVRKLNLDLAKQQQEETSKLAGIEINYLLTVNKLMKEYTNTKAGPEGDARRLEITQDLQNISKRYEVEYAGILKVAEAKKKLSLEDSQYSQRALAYGDIFEKAFQGMGDVMVDFAKTGKLSFEGLISSMIEGLIRYEMQLQATAMYAAARPALLQFFTTAFGGTPGGTGSSFIDAGSVPLPSNIGANGLVYGSGGRIDKFAQGGMFTNSIVTEPTLFKFAKGTGLMGEAGPEAIMPLKRDSSGSLGVQGGGSNVEVVVNNYSGEKAETTETMDSRGNRKIEVVIGDMTAGEISRNGSQSQRAMRGTFGLQPQLIRR